MSCELFNQPRFREAAGSEFRPGGLGLTEELASECGLEPGWRVLDVGCGVGSTPSFLARHYEVATVGLDRSPGFIEEAEARDHSVTWMKAHAAGIPYPDGYFDAVFAECFLSGVDDRPKVLTEVGRVLRPGGRLAVTDMYLRRPEASSSLDSLPPATCLRGAVGKDDMLALLEEAGFAVRVWRDCSEVLRAFTASLVFSYGSAASFWHAVLGPGESLRDRVALARPGYCLLIAEARPVPSADPPGSRRLPNTGAG